MIEDNTEIEGCGVKRPTDNDRGIEGNGGIVEQEWLIGQKI